ncbi:ATP synthase epsilon chain [Buchnera aphidicola (Eriosoma grossulariae)]|uniref:ATP synthase F1 subunit epsilon n=1 Tax=Buchnera aphidicola TaxID=9 RepID=UPI003463CDFD
MNCYLNVVSLEKKIFSGKILKIKISGIEGELGIYPGHSQLLTMIQPGLLALTNIDKTTEYIYLSGGILEIQPQLITILSDTAIRGVDLDIELIKKSKKEVEKMIKNNVNKIDLKIKLIQTIAKLKVIEVMKKSKN